ncbi:MAG: protein-(glutamine-N5) methyltransferase, release factor-specific [Gammaproteobacteria bacterium]|nr:MAG: protein-(glutamine-N5) methyltransferase, release factor-specific [Gammaproteobacteria bacterium]
MAQIKDLLVSAVGRLDETSPTAQLDAELLLAYVLDKNRTWLKTWPDAEPSVDEAQQFQQLIERRSTGEPVAYLTGEQAFWSLNLHVSPATLIPRPETELLVEKILAAKTAEKGISLLDLGTGSGAIALALASEKPGWKIDACDQSEAALLIAEQNRAKYDLSVTFSRSNWFSDYQGRRFDVIVSNPPYIEENDHHLFQGDVRFEPITALASGKDGLDAIRRIVSEAKTHLNENGLLIFEHGYQQASAVQHILVTAGFSRVATHRDLSGHDRVTLGYK